MFFLKKLLFKVMELGLGLRTCFSLETKDPIFINFKLSPDEVEKVKNNLPAEFSLKPVRFFESDELPAYWISYNFYELKYPKPELASIRKARLEINTFVEDSQGRKGIFVFSGSPFVSKEKKKTPIGLICDFAEWLVIRIYGCGKLTSLDYSLTDRLRVSLLTEGHSVHLDRPSPDFRSSELKRLSSDYLLYNDISFFNGGKTCDFVNVNSAFYEARFAEVPVENSEAISGPFVNRKPDFIWVHRGEISYLVNSMNRTFLEFPAHG